MLEQVLREKEIWPEGLENERRFMAGGVGFWRRFATKYQRPGMWGSSEPVWVTLNKIINSEDMEPHL